MKPSVHIFYFLSVAFLVLLTTSCTKLLESEAEKKLAENEKEIQTYIAGSRLNFQKTTTGLHYHFLKSNPSGIKPNVGDEVTMHYTVFRMNGAKIDSTERLKNKPFSFAFGAQSFVPGLAEGISMMRTGERALFLMNHSLGFGNRSDDLLPAFSAVGFDIEILRVRTEDQQINDYIKDKNLTVTETTPSGLRFIRLTTTTNDPIKTGDNLRVKYTGRLLNDRQFDSGELPVRVGAGSVIKGFEEGLTKMRLGEKALLIFPSSIGYGKTGQGPIPPYSPLVFEVEANK
ncbi:MAG: FKBP-type peptidyl-prolyl cis-trans isomerase [Runella sp.]